MGYNRASFIHVLGVPPLQGFRHARIWRAYDGLHPSLLYAGPSGLIGAEGVLSGPLAAMALTFRTYGAEEQL